VLCGGSEGILAVINLLMKTPTFLPEEEIAQGQAFFLIFQPVVGVYPTTNESETDA